jgi:hypothetical protein
MTKNLLVRRTTNLAIITGPMLNLVASGLGLALISKTGVQVWSLNTGMTSMCRYVLYIQVWYVCTCMISIHIHVDCHLYTGIASMYRYDLYIDTIYVLVWPLYAGMVSMYKHAPCTGMIYINWGMAYMYRYDFYIKVYALIRYDLYIQKTHR